VSGKVSIIIPVFNGQRFIHDAIESALGQTYKNKEVIVVDDGSTDITWNIVRSYRFRAMGIWQKNSGASAARNNGIANSSGEFILPLDADDRIDPLYLEKTVPLMSDSAVGVVTTQYQCFENDDRTFRPVNPTLTLETADNVIPVCSLIRRSAFDQTPGYTSRFVDVNGVGAIGYEDWNLWLDILKRGWKVAVVDEPLFHYRVKVAPTWKKEPSDESLRQIIRSLHPELYGRT
jgi:glycosyltransferase involved in cell wall biosynthesis